MRRRLLVALLLVAVACGGDDDPALESSGTTTSTLAGQRPTTSRAAEPDAPVSSPEASTPDLPGEPDAGDVETNGPPGSAAPLYLQPRPATSIVVEVSAEDGAAPTSATVDHLRAVLGDVSAKAVSVTSVAAPPSRQTWTSDDLRDAADEVAVASQGEQAALRMLFVHGAFAESDTALGVAVRADVVAIFADNVDRAASPLVGPGAIEAAVVVHEIGHVLGLVDVYRDTNRDDPEHPGHSTNRASVMYWAVESSLVADILTGGPPRDFDEADLADLAAIRAGA